MKFTELAIAALLVIAPVLPVHAEDAAAPAAPAAAQPEAPPPSVPRPAIVPKTAEPAPTPVTEDPAPQRHRRYVHRYRHYGYYRTGCWEPFPISFPHLYHNHIRWNRIPWPLPF